MRVSLLQRLAGRSTHRQHHHAAIVTRGGAVVAQGYNHGQVHAEVHALSKLWPSERVGTRVWSLRLTWGGKLAMARPCGRCQEYLRTSGVKVVYYSTVSGTIAKLRLDVPAKMKDPS